VDKDESIYAQATLNEVLEPPWTATSRRWHQYEDESGVIVVDRRDTVHDAESNIYLPADHLPVVRCGRTHAKPDRHSQPAARCQLVNTINYSPDESFESTITGCRCLVLTVTYDMPAGPAASAPMSTGSSVLASASAAASGSCGGTSVASAQAARLQAAAELKLKSEAAEAAAASLLADEEAEKVAEASKQARSLQKKQRQKQKNVGGSQGQPPSRGALAGGRDAEENAADAEGDGVARADARAELAPAEERAVANAAAAAAAAAAERAALRAGAAEAASFEASRRLAEDEARTRAEAASAE
jgi:hypothetical protein